MRNVTHIWTLYSPMLCNTLVPDPPRTFKSAVDLRCATLPSIWNSVIKCLVSDIRLFAHPYMYVAKEIKADT